MAKLAIALDEPCAYFLLLSRLENGVGEWTGGTCGARAHFEELAWYMRQVFG